MNTMDPFTAEKVAGFKQAELLSQAGRDALSAPMVRGSKVMVRRPRHAPRMGPLAKRYVRLALTTLGFAGLLVALNTVPSAATPPIGQTSTVVARGTACPTEPFQSHRVRSSSS